VSLVRFLIAHPDALIAPVLVVAFAVWPLRWIIRIEKEVDRKNTLVSLWLDGWVLTHSRHDGDLSWLPWAAIRAEREEQARESWLSAVARFNQTTLTRRSLRRRTAQAEPAITSGPELPAIEAAPDASVPVVMIDGREVHRWWAV